MPHDWEDFAGDWILPVARDDGPTNVNREIGMMKVSAMYLVEGKGFTIETAWFAGSRDDLLLTEGWRVLKESGGTVLAQRMLL
jgi:hypothetical protein